LKRSCAQLRGHELTEYAFSYTAIRNTNARRGPDVKNGLEDRTACYDEIRPLGSDTRQRRASGDRHAGELLTDRLHVTTWHMQAIDLPPIIDRQFKQHARKRCYGSTGAKQPRGL
jgi:hypothetical protein